MFAIKQKRVPQTERLVTLPIDQVKTNPYQPRKHFSQENLVSLAKSIREHGLLQPVIVRPLGENYELIAGERRLRACKMAGMTSIEALLVNAHDVESACMALVENIQREGLHFFEEAASYVALMQSAAFTQEQLAAHLGKSQPSVANKLRVYRLSPRVKAAIVEAKLTERHARALLRLCVEQQQLSAVVHIREKLLTVKETEKYVDSFYEQRRPSSGHVVRMMRDYRLFVNTMKTAVSDLKDAGVDANFSMQDDGDVVTITVVVPKTL